jgi:uncharacterized coiled-coil protein SlyX
MAPVDSSPFDLNTLISGGTGAGLMGVLIFAVKLVLDRTIPNRSDARANVGMVLEGLNNMVKVLQEEKIADAKRLTDRQVRIESLESSADKDYDRISELRSEITELRARLAQKERHINTLVQELRKLGARVVGVELDGLADSDIRVITDRLFGGAPTTAPVSTRTGATPLQNS